MAAFTPPYPLGCPQEVVQVCNSHNSPVDLTCEDCDCFICSTCAKTDHRDHNWSTESATANKRRRQLSAYLQRVREEELPAMHRKIEQSEKQKTENESQCDTEIQKIDKHCDEIIARINEIKNSYRQVLRDDLQRKNGKAESKKSKSEDKMKRVLEMVGSLENNNSVMSDHMLIDSYRQLTRLLSEQSNHAENCELSVIFNEGKIDENVLKSMIGQTIDVNVIETHSFQYEEGILVLKACNDEECYIQGTESDIIEQVSCQGKTTQRYRLNPFYFCVNENKVIYFTDNNNKSIGCLNPKGTVTTIVSTKPLVPIAICQVLDDQGLLVTLKDDQSETAFDLTPESRCLLRQLTLAGETVREFEYQKDGKTRLFVGPLIVTQNGNTDICVVNATSESSTELVILSSSGCLKSVYHGQRLAEDFIAQDVVCDSLYNILVSDQSNHCVHLLCPDGGFLRFLLTQRDIDEPSSLSLNKSTLWVGNTEGIVKVYQYKSTSSVGIC